MNKLRKILSYIVMTCMVLGLVACSPSGALKDKEKLMIVTTIFPEYDWVREILGDEVDNVELIMLLDNGVDLHSFQPTAQDIANIAVCDIFIYVGGESDGWVDDALAEATNKDMKVINLLDVLGDDVKEEEVIEGMEGEEDEGDEEVEYDEHVWLSLKNAQALVQKISDTICEADSEHKSLYEENTSTYIEKLKSLDEEYQAVVNEGTKDTILFGDRFPFRYMVDDYGLNYYAAFSGCSAETEASFETIVFLSDKLDELGLDYIFVIENSNEDIAKTIIENTKSKNQQILKINSMQGVTAKDVEEGVTYLSIMDNNLNVLKEALK
ncbi:MAG: zinc ABC transporter substrate-binding protein [Lachnospiraceae bacterium]|nr:zinc ABC transporter substrate-binding protein [Lachnospiraceae bacterium]